MTRCGICIAGDEYRASKFPLVGVNVHYTVIDTTIRANIIHTYISALKAPTDKEPEGHAEDINKEVVYTFPLPSGAAVCAFSATIEENKVIRGVVKGKEEAKQVYADAVNEGKTAALLEEKRDEVFQIALGNVKPGGKIQVNISFVAAIPNDVAPDTLRLVVPLNVAPHYGTPRDVAAPHLMSESGPPDITMSFEMTGTVTSIESTTHPLAVALGRMAEDSVKGETMNPKKAFVRMTAKDYLKKDIVLVVKAAGLDVPRCVAATISILQASGADAAIDAATTSTAMALTLVPRFSLAPIPAQRYVFLVDRSGSMDGQRIIQTRAALQILLRSLPSKETRFNIVSFGSDVDAFWDSGANVENLSASAAAFRPYSRDTVSEASAFVDGMKADYGGTEIRKALYFTFGICGVDAQDADAMEPTAVIVLMDGEAWDVPGVKETVATAVGKTSGKLRVFVLGIGEDVSRAMCDGIANSGNGVASYVGDNEKPAEKLVGLLRAARVPAVRVVSVNWGFAAAAANEDFDMLDDIVPVTKQVNNKDMQLLESALPGAVYAGFRVSTYALAETTASGWPLATEVIVRGIADSQPVEMRVPVVESSAFDIATSGVHSLSARSIMQRLETLALNADEDGDEESATDKSAAVAARVELVRLGTTYNLASSHTSFVAIDESSNELVGVGEDDLDVPVPVTVAPYVPPAGSYFGAGINVGGSGRGKGGRGLGLGGAKRHRKILITTPDTSDAEEDENDEDEDGDGTPPKKKAKLDVPVGPFANVLLDDIVRLQNFDGLFEAKELAQVLGLEELPRNSVATNEGWATVLALAWMENVCAEQKDAWMFIAEKARDALVGEGVQEPMVDGLVKDGWAALTAVAPAVA